MSRCVVVYDRETLRIKEIFRGRVNEEAFRLNHPDDGLYFCDHAPSGARYVETDEEGCPVGFVTRPEFVGWGDIQVSRAIDVSSGNKQILMVSSWDEKCGISEYTKTLVHYLKSDCGISILPRQKISMRLQKQYDLIHIQYEASLYNDDLLRFIENANVPVLLTAHHYDEFCEKISRNVDQIIVHHPSFRSRFTYIMQGCPVFPEIKAIQQVREKYGMPVDKRIISSFGFIMPWKQIDLFFSHFANIIADRDDIFVQLLHAKYPRSPGLSEQVEQNIRDTIAYFDITDKVFVSHDFLSKVEINERLQVSDVGYIWGVANTLGSSATTKEFIAARCPVFLRNCNHYDDLEKGCVKIEPVVPPSDFIDRMVSVDDRLLSQLRLEQRENYETCNYQEVARRHLEIYEKYFGRDNHI